MEIKLLELNLKNFKGIKSLKVTADGRDVNIFGENSTGKTSIYDSFTWLLFDKDSQNKKDFSIKTLEPTGAVKNGLEHEVEGTFELVGKDGSRTIKFKKVYVEKWTKTRGSAERTFSGNTTNYFVDGVPTKKADYEQTISDLIDEDTFKLITSPTFFNDQLHWEECRKVLFEIAGGVTDSEVIASNKDLSRLPEILGSRKIDDHQKVLKESRSEINKELEKIPVRIDEVNIALPDITGLDLKAITKEKDEFVAKRRAKEDEVMRIESGGEIAEKTKQLREVESDILSLKNKHKERGSEADDKAREAISKMKDGISDIAQIYNETSGLIISNDNDIKRRKEENEVILKDWKEVNGQEFVNFSNFTDHLRDGNGLEGFTEPDTFCPTCNQKLPKADVEAARVKAEENFNTGKSRQLEELDERGRVNREIIEEHEATNVALKESLKEADDKIEENKKLLASAEEARTIGVGNIKSLEDTPEHQKAVKLLSSLTAEISALGYDNDDAIDKVRKDIHDLDETLTGLWANIDKFEKRESGQTRIDELKDQEKKLAREFESLESDLFTIEQFEKSRASILSERINSKFKIVTFKLFKELISGGLEPCCEVLVNGVPHNSLNSAGRIQSGLDVIYTLSKHYDIKAPIWLDNRESVLELPEMDCQLISLFVKEGVKELKIETVK